MAKKIIKEPSTSVSYLLLILQTKWLAEASFCVIQAENLSMPQYVALKNLSRRKSNCNFYAVVLSLFLNVSLQYLEFMYTDTIQYQRTFIVTYYIRYTGLQSWKSCPFCKNTFHMHYNLQFQMVFNIYIYRRICFDVFDMNYASNTFIPRDHGR